MGASGGQTVTQEVDPQFANRLYTLYGDAQRYANSTPYQQYGGQAVAGLQPFQQAAQSYLSNALLGQNLGFSSPDRYTTNPYSQFSFSPVQQHQTGDPNRYHTDGLAGLGEPVVNNQSTREPTPGEIANPDLGTMSTRTGIDIGNATFNTGEQSGIPNPFTNIPHTGPWSPFGSLVDRLNNTRQQIASAYDPTDPGNHDTSTTTFDPGGPTGDYSTAYPYDPTGNDPTDPRNVTFNRTPGTSGGQYAANGLGLAGYTPQTGAQGMSAYQNPWENQVVQQGINDMVRAADIGMESSVFSKGAGTYGGDRAALQAAEQQRNLLDRVGAFSGQLRSQGFNTAAQNAQMDANRFLTGNQMQFNNVLRTGDVLNAMGNQNQQLAQGMMDYDRSQFYEARDYPMSQFGLMQGILSGMPVGMSTYYPGGSAAGGFAGGAMTGAGIGSAFGPWGAGIGALGGGLLGMF